MFKYDYAQVEVALSSAVSCASVTYQKFGRRSAHQKCSGEPPLVLAASAFYAVRYAIAAARKEQGFEGFFRLDAPATPRVIALLCNPKIENFQLNIQ